MLITGMGASLFASTSLEYALCSRQIDANAVEGAELLHYRHSAYRNAVAVVVSKSGKSVEITRLITLLKGRLPIIGITNEPDSPLAREADVSLYVASLGDKSVAIQSYTGTLLAEFLLYRALDNSLEAARGEIEDLLPQFSKLIGSGLENIRSWDAFLGDGFSMCLLARGPSYASALEGALLFNEVAKVPAAGMPAASFRHGPVEIVDQRFRGLIFAPQGPTRDLNLALAKDLARFGGRVRVVGPTQPGAFGFDWYDIPAVPEILSPIFEIVPVQLAALRMAELCGLTPGTFRYIPHVVLDEASFIPR